MSNNERNEPGRRYYRFPKTSAGMTRALMLKSQARKKGAVVYDMQYTKDEIIVPVKVI